MKYSYRALIFLLLSLLGSCVQSHDLGDGLSLMEGDKTEDRVIVYCTGKSGGECFIGIPVIPSRRDSTSRYVEKAVSNQKWMLASTVNRNKSKSYWIVSKGFKVDIDNCETINCDSVIQAHVIGPLNIVAFKSQLKKLNIKPDLWK